MPHETDMPGLLAFQHKVSYVAQYELIGRMPSHSTPAAVVSDSGGASSVGSLDRHGSIDATVEWTRHSTLLQQPPSDVLAVLVSTAAGID